jgi:type II secretory pathway component PulK
VIDACNRRGFTTITVLWVMTVGAIVAAAGALTGRNAVNAATNRVHLERAFWVATGCVARVQWAIDTTLAESKTFEEAAVRWRVLGRIFVIPSPSVILSEAKDLLSVGSAPCSTSLEAAGTRLDMNGASEEMLQSLFVALRHRADAAALAAALADWRDSDDVARPEGAERDWYAAQHRELPRNAPLADVRELTRVRGFENALTFEPFLSAEPGRISLATASAPVLLAVPGFTPGTAEQIVSLQNAGTPVADVMSLLGRVSRSSADSILAHFPEIVRVTTADPDAWVLTVRATLGIPPVTVSLARRLLRAGKRAVVVSSRSDP